MREHTDQIKATAEPEKSTTRNQTMHQAAARCSRQVIASLQQEGTDPEWVP